MKKENRKIYLIDGNSLCYRAYYAIQELKTSKGLPTNAIYGFINMLRKIVRDHAPDMMIMVFDMAGPTGRHEKYEDYKVDREPMPDDLAEQMDRIKDVVEAHNIPIAQLEGYEADDIIATIAEKAKKKGMEVTIVTGDKDALQLVEERVRVLSPHTSSDKLYRAEEVVEKFGVEPDAMVELMALMGDPSDNIPGVKGIGKVTAGKLIKEYGSVKNIYKNIEDISSAALKKKLEEGKDLAMLSRELVELDRKVPVKVDFSSARLKEPDNDRLSELYAEFEFSKLLRDIAPAESGTGRYSAIGGEKEASDLAGKAVADKKIALKVIKDGDGRGVDGIALCREEGRAFFARLDSGKLKKTVKGLLEDAAVVKIGFDIKRDILALRREGIEMAGDLFDVMVADYLDDPSRPRYELEEMAMRRLGYNLSGEGGGGGWDESGQGTIDLSAEAGYAAECEKCDVIFRLYGELGPVLAGKSLDILFHDVEMPLVRVLADMEEEGVGIDTGYLKKRSAALEKELTEVSGRIYKLAGEEFNINSPKQLQVILYEKLGLPALKKTKTGVSTDESVLRKLASMHELPGKLLEYREMNKLKTAYYDSILELTDKKTRKLHARFNQAVTATGRLSSSEPNLQNIPVKTPLGREIRKAFLPGGKGRMLLGADYSQVELRILAHLSGDKKLAEAFGKEEDVHRYTASLIFDCAQDEVSAKMRSAAKTVNFGIIYGMSAFGLAKDLGIRVDEAQSFIDAYFNRYSGVKAFIDKTIKGARKNGYVTTLLNRRRYIPEINSRNEHVKNFAERAAVNTPVQGSAADLIKLAMIKCHDRYKGADITMTIQVHDELVFEVPGGRVREAAEEVKDIMENVVELKVPLKVDLESGPNWLDMQDVDL